jgi:phage baseplate assembly protein W
MTTAGYENTRLSPSTEKSFKPLTSRSYRGYSSVNASEKSKNLFDLELIKQDLINHFHIKKGEKLMNPTFGTIIWDLLFEPLTPLVKELIVKDVTEIVNSDPRTKVIKTIVTQVDKSIQVEVSLIYLPYNIQENLQFKFDSENGLI